MSSFAALRQQRQARRAPRFGAPASSSAATVAAAEQPRPDTTSASAGVAPTRHDKQPTALSASDPAVSSPNPASKGATTDGEAWYPATSGGNGAEAKALIEPTAGPGRLTENGALVVKQVQGKGRGVVWQPASLQAGTCNRGEILMRLRPAASALSSNLLAKRCSHCYQAAAVDAVESVSAASQQTSSSSSGSALMRCSACKVVRYCNIECQRGDWQQHRDECKALRNYAKLRAEARAQRKQHRKQAVEAMTSRRAQREAGIDEMSVDGEDEDLEGHDEEEGRDDDDDDDDDDETEVVPGAVIRAMARLIWARKRACEPLGRRIDQLQSHKDEMDQATLQSLAFVPVALAHFLAASRVGSLSDLATKQKKVLQDLGLGSASHLLDAVCKFNSNAFTLTDYEMDSIGICLHPTASLLNHSCCPNAALVFPFSGGDHGGPSAVDKGHRAKMVAEPMQLVALRDIEAGEEVEISYVDVCDRYAERQQALKARYLFDCRCFLCERTRKQQQKQQHSSSTATGSAGQGAAASAKFKWRDPREAVWCPQRCGGWIGRPSREGDLATALVCNKCKEPSTLDAAAMAADVREGTEAIQEARTLLARGDAAAAWQRCSKVVAELVDRYPPSSQPLFDLMRVAQEALIELGSLSLPPAPAKSSSSSGELAEATGSWPVDPDTTSYFFEEATRLAMLIAAGCQASTVGPATLGGSIYAEGHPARAMALATLGKLALVEIQQQPVAAAAAARRNFNTSSHSSSSSSSSSVQQLVRRPSSIPSVLKEPPHVPTEARLPFAKQVLIQALRELEIGFGRSNEGGVTGKAVKQALEELERESAIVAQALRDGGRGGIAAA